MINGIPKKVVHCLNFRNENEQNKSDTLSGNYN